MIYIKEAQDPRASLWDFTPVGRVVTDTCDEDELEELEDSIYAPLRQAQGKDAYWDAVAKLTDEEKQALEEISLREMVMSCLVYGSDIRTSKNINMANGRYYGMPYAQEYYDLLGKDVADEIIDQQTEYFNKGNVISDVWTDGEGVTYNSFQKPEKG